MRYMVVNHVEHNHSIAIKNLLKIYPDIKIVGNAKTVMMLKDLGLSLNLNKLI